MVMSGHPNLARDIPVLEAKGIACLLKPFRRRELEQVVNVLMGEEVIGPSEKRNHENSPGG
jgi:hypothetical protein